MRCPNCGHEVKEGLAFCTNCGSPLPGKNNASQRAHASARPNICPKCGSILPEGSEFCPNCGARVAGFAGQIGSPADPSRTQPMPALSQNSPRVEAAPAPPQEGYSMGANGMAGPAPKRGGSKAPLVIIGVVVVAALVAVVAMALLGMGPFQSSDNTSNGQAAIETTNGSVPANDNQANNANNTSAGNLNENEASGNANSVAANANQSIAAATENANASANASDGANANNASSSANANANTSDDSSTSGSVSLNSGYVSNSNSTYGYSLRVPTSFTLSGSDSAGNATLTDTASPCVITVSVDNNPNGYTVEQALANASAGSSSNAYTAEGNGWYVFSDEPNGSVYYVMSYVQQGRTISLQFRYPASAKSQCDPIIESVQPTFSVN